MKKSYLNGSICSAIFFLFALPANAALVTITFDSLEIADSDRHNISSYTEAGLTFTGPDSIANSGIFYDGQSGQAYQGSAAIYVAPSQIVTIEAPSGAPMLDLVSIDFADLCGGGVINSQCQDPGHDIYFRLTTYTSDGTSIATQDNLLSEGVSGGFNTFSFPSPLFDGVPVGKIEISAQSGNLAYLQIDNLVFEPSPVPVPPAFWLFGSGLLGLVGIARRKKDA